MSEIALVSVVVADYDEAISFYRDALGFSVAQDERLSETKRWVVMRPPGSRGTGLLLARADGDRQQERVGDQTGGRVALFLHTDDFAADYRRMSDAGVHFTEGPRDEAYGMVAVFEDLYGNRWDLVQPSG